MQCRAMYGVLHACMALTINMHTDCWFVVTTALQSTNIYLHYCAPPQTTKQIIKPLLGTDERRTVYECKQSAPGFLSPASGLTHTYIDVPAC
jgi:hypothetical protein